MAAIGFGKGWEVVINGGAIGSGVVGVLLGTYMCIGRSTEKQTKTGLPVVNPAMTLHAEQVCRCKRANIVVTISPGLLFSSHLLFVFDTDTHAHPTTTPSTGTQSIRILAPLPTDGATLTTRSKILVRVHSIVRVCVCCFMLSGGSRRQYIL